MNRPTFGTGMVEQHDSSGFLFWQHFTTAIFWAQGEWDCMLAAQSTIFAQFHPLTHKSAEPYQRLGLYPNLGLCYKHDRVMFMGSDGTLFDSLDKLQLRRVGEERHRARWSSTTGWLPLQGRRAPKATERLPLSLACVDRHWCTSSCHPPCFLDMT